ncbi:lantibiotic dehydratase [Streptomyces hydrogenans]|uniref:lantibiotic dehydratase n=1 Tax=Streptomyces hydrogenans TaxID=1873719 RepID=UPI00332D91BD
MRQYVKELACIPELVAAVRLASPSLAADVQRVVEGHPVRLKVLRRVVVSLTKYRLRMTQRPTPFGLFAGVALAEIGPRPRLDVGSEHRSVSRPDAGWLREVLDSVLALRPALARARLVANDLHTVREGRLVLVDFHSPAGRELAPSVRHTTVVRAVLLAAREPVAWPDLVEAIRASYPHAGDEAVVRCLEQLVGSGFLLTDLVPPPDCASPLGHVLDRLDGLDHPLVGRLHEIHAALRALDDAAPAHRLAALIHAEDLMRALAPSDHPLQCDLLFDARVTLPVDVADEAAVAADVLARLHTRHPGPTHLRAYHERFLERYGTDRTVPVLELLDDARGLGLPRTGERGGTEQGATTATERDRLLGRLLHDATRRGSQEIVLDDATVRQLQGEAPARSPRSADVGVEVVASTWDALCAGEFRLVLGLSPVSSRAGSAFGRFVPALGAEAEERVRHLVAAAEAVGDAEAVTATVAFQPSVARSANVASVPQWLPYRIPLGVGPAATPSTQDLRVNDLGVRATPDRLHLVRTATGQRIHPATYSMINPQSGHVPGVARFLVELGRQDEVPPPGWNWGLWAAAPALPRVRYGKSVLCPAHWASDELRSDATSPCGERQWTERVRRWRAQWEVPRHVQLNRGDHRIAVDLDNPLHLLVFRDEVRRGAGLIVIERFGGADRNDWFRSPEGSHACEFVVPVLGAGRPPEPTAGPRTPGTRSDALRTARSPYPPPRHLPGGPWLYAKLYAPERHQRGVLTHHLGRLSGTAPSRAADTWFFLRYADPEPHLRLRFHGEPQALWGELLPDLRAWASELESAGLVSRLVLDTYEPEVHRYGGAEAIGHAERVFHADSLTVLRQLASPTDEARDLPDVSLAALGVLDILSHLCDTPSAVLDLLRGAPVEDLRGRVQRAEKQRLSALIDEHGRAHPTLADELWRARRTALRGLRELLDTDASPQDAGPTDVSPAAVAMSLAHMHCNRSLGIDRDKELLVYATAHETLALRLDRKRHGR